MSAAACVPVSEGLWFVKQGLKRKPGNRLRNSKSKSKSMVHMAYWVVSWLANETREL